MTDRPKRFEVIPRSEANGYPVRVNFTWPALILFWSLALAGAWFVLLAIILAVHDAVT